MAVEIKNSRSILSSLTFSPPEPRKLYKKDERSLSYYNDIKSFDSDKLSLFDVSNAFNKLVNENGIKLISQEHSKDGSQYNFDLSKKQRNLSLIVKKDTDTFDIKLKDENGETINSLKTDDRKYRENDIYRFLKTNVNQIEERKLFTQEQLMDIKVFTVPLESKFINLGETKFDITFSTDSETTATASVNDILAFQIRIEQIEEEDFLVITNNIDDEGFAQFHEDHFEFRRSLNEQDNEHSIDAYFDYIVPQLIQKLDSLINPASGLENIYTLLQSSFSDFHLVKQEIEGSDVEKYLLVLIFKTSSDNNRLAKFQVIEVEHDKYQLLIERSGQEYTINLIPGKFEDIINSVKYEIISSLEEAKNIPRTIHSIYAAIEAIIKENFCLEYQSDLSTGVDVYNHFSITFDKTPEEDTCDLGKGVIKAELFLFGYMQYLHIVFENNLILEEFMLAINSSFKSNLANSFTELFSELAELNKQTKEEEINGDVDFEKLSVIANDVSGDRYKCEKIEEDDFECSEVVEGNKFTVLRLIKSKDENQGDFFRINVFNPLNENTEEGKFINPEFVIPIKHNEKLAQKVETHLKEFFARFG